MELDKLIEKIAEEVYRKIERENNGLNKNSSNSVDLASIIDHTSFVHTVLPLFWIFSM